MDTGCWFLFVVDIIFKYFIRDKHFFATHERSLFVFDHIHGGGFEFISLHSTPISWLIVKNSGQLEPI